MREINIASVIVSKRKEKGLTQDALAEHMGVTKASVSKWETAQSYPDITLLPQLATFFNISIDELIGYMPQMTADDIKRTYQKLSLAFSKKPFDEVYETCQVIIKKYYACFPLLLRMALLLINHSMLTQVPERQVEVLKEAIALCERVRNESEDVWLVKQANSYEALGYLMINEPVMVLDRLEDTIKPLMSDEMTLAYAYQQLGQNDKSKHVLQASMYQHLLSILGAAPAYFQLLASNQEKFEESLKRFIGLATIFNVDQLSQNTMAQLYYAAAQVQAINGNLESCLSMVESYTEVCTKITFPLMIKGDYFFDSIDEWLKALIEADGPPRSEKVIKESVLLGLTQNPAFNVVKEDVRFKQCIYKINDYIGASCMI